MTYIADHAPVTDQETIPSEWLTELNGYDERSHEYKELALALGQLAAEAGLSWPGPEATESKQVPDGFISAETVPDPVRIQKKQFEGIIHAFGRDTPEEIQAEAVEYKTDAGRTVRMIDLRPSMSSGVQKGGPEHPREKERLDKLVMRDVKILADSGTPRNTVKNVSGVCYSKASSNKIRAYWMPIKVTGDPGAPLTIARIADCANSERAESDLYRAVFERTL